MVCSACVRLSFLRSVAFSLVALPRRCRHVFSVMAVLSLIVVSPFLSLTRGERLRRDRTRCQRTPIFKEQVLTYSEDCSVRIAVAQRLRPLRCGRQVVSSGALCAGGRGGDAHGKLAGSIIVRAVRFAERSMGCVMNRASSSMDRHPVLQVRGHLVSRGH